MCTCPAVLNLELYDSLLQSIDNFFFSATGYIHVNVDEGWLKDRDSNGNIVEDRVKFPSGMKALGEWIHDQEVPGKGLRFELC